MDLHEEAELHSLLERVAQKKVNPHHHLKIPQKVISRIIYDYMEPGHVEPDNEDEGGLNEWYFK